MGLLLLLVLTAGSIVFFYQLFDHDSTSLVFPASITGSVVFQNPSVFIKPITSIHVVEDDLDTLTLTRMTPSTFYNDRDTLIQVDGSFVQGVPTFLITSADGRYTATIDPSAFLSATPTTVTFSFGQGIPAGTYTLALLADDTTDQLSSSLSFTVLTAQQLIRIFT